MKRKFLAVFTFMMLLIFATAFVACTDYTQKEDPKDEEKATVTYDQVAANGTFYNVTSSDKDDVYNSVSNWTVSAAGFSAPTNGKNEALGVFAGALDLTGNKIASVLNGYQIKTKEDPDENGNEVLLDTPVAFTNPGVDPRTPKTAKLDEDGKPVGDETVNQDNNAFLFASTKTSGSIYLKSDSITLAKDSVYQFSFSVCSKVENAASGAFVFIRGDMEKEYVALNTDNEWKEYTLYIETNKSADMTITVELWLGYGPKKSTSSTGNDQYAARGFAMFDNIIFTKLVDKVENEQKEALFSDTTGYEHYDENKTIHENFVGFSENRTDVYTAYYLKDANLANRTHLTSSSYFGDSSSYRKYFYEFRDYSSSNTSSTYWSKNSDFTAGSEYYGIVNPEKLYKADKTLNYSNMSGKFMDYNTWQSSVLDDRFSGLDEKYVLMIYNNKLGASGFTTADANAVSIDANTCYEISVWAYVWTTNYTGTASYDGSNDGSILPAYSATDKPKTITDPLAESTTTYTSAQKAVYNVYKKYAEANSASVLLNATIGGENKAINFFDMSEAEKTELGDFGASDLNAFMSTFKTKPMEAPDADKKYYDDIVIKVREWLKGNDSTFGLTISDTDTLPSEAFLYTYLYYSYLGAGSIVGTIDYDQTKLVSLGFTEDFLRKAYLYERSQNIKTKDTMKAAVEKYDTEKDQYDKDMDEYNKAVELYKTECLTWLNANKHVVDNTEVSIPHATFRVSGAGDEYDAVTTETGKWKKLTLYIRGNQLSARSVSLSLLFGENDTATKKMIGGVFFDNIEVKQVNYDANVAWHTLSELSSDDEIAFGGLISEIDPVTQEANVPTAENWKFDKAADTAENDKSKVNVAVEEDDSLQTIIIEKIEKKFASYKLVYKHTEATASTLWYDAPTEELIKILPNKYYRFAFQVKTVDVDGGINIVLQKKQEDGEISDFSTAVSAYTSKDWSEVVYYIHGAKDSTWFLSLEVTMGSGTRFDTSAYVKGQAEFASFNCLEITKSEYDSHKTGDKIVDSLSLDNVTYDIDGGLIKNASYSAIDYAGIKDSDFDDDGIKYSSIVPVQNWTVGTEYHNPYDVVTVNRNESVISWSRPKGYDSNGNEIENDEVEYEIWAKYQDDNNKEQSVLLAITEQTTFDLNSLANYDTWRDCSVFVKTVSNKAVSALSSAVTISHPENDGTAIPKAATDDLLEYTVKAGARKINSEDFFDSAYTSAYDYLYTISSDYYAAVAVTSSSASLSANTFYKISVWVKT
ncbi:MAG: hypothetical protein J5781_03720, partial [Clostridia bacterium]|nr:hypothetical protein [Clostridia bacterium]